MYFHHALCNQARPLASRTQREETRPTPAQTHNGKSEARLEICTARREKATHAGEGAAVVTAVAAAGDREEGGDQGSGGPAFESAESGSSEPPSGSQHFL